MTLLISVKCFSLPAPISHGADKSRSMLLSLNGLRPSTDVKIILSTRHVTGFLYFGADLHDVMLSWRWERFDCLAHE